MHAAGAQCTHVPISHAPLPPGLYESASALLRSAADARRAQCSERARRYLAVAAEAERCAALRALAAERKQADEVGQAVACLRVSCAAAAPERASERRGGAGQEARWVCRACTAAGRQGGLCASDGSGASAT